MKKMTWLFTAILLGVQTLASGAEINVSAAASLKDCLNEIIALYQKEVPNAAVVANYAASGTLQQQIDNGAPADLFISADKKRMDALEKKQLLVSDSRRDLLHNKVVLIVPKNGKSTITSFKDLGTDKLKERELAIGDPKSVPAGTYAMEIFDFLGITEAVKPKAVLAQTVRAVLAYVAQNEADAGVVYLTDALLMKDKVRIVEEAPEKSHTPTIYPAAVVVTGKNPQGGKSLLDFLLSAPSAAVFKKYGFEPIPQK
ncbi:MAG: molybdate ABC transporter substrate-binding protein [Planctomycetaceae bacterium]|jgi:molybdate transport system substrate-binding protein|nr:molybdate ABC transporter substrate-binding protein [Planctomycetaceae bacterium]